MSEPASMLAHIFAAHTEALPAVAPRDGTIAAPSSARARRRSRPGHGRRQSIDNERGDIPSMSVIQPPPLVPIPAAVNGYPIVSAIRERELDLSWIVLCPCTEQRPDFAAQPLYVVWLYLPVTVPRALLSVGDGHGAQGDGEVGGTAIECGMTTTP
jgi:hypothetical protein